MSPNRTAAPQEKQPLHFIRKHPGFRPGKGLPTVKRLESSPYYWWWQYLRRSQDYKRCCAQRGRGALSKLYAEFGDVHSSDFADWWLERGRGLFSEPLTFTRTRVASSAEELRAEDFKSALVVVIPLHYTKRMARKRFGELLRRHHPGRRSRTDLKKSRAKYPLWTEPNVRALKKTLSVYDLRFSEPDLSLYEIGERLHLQDEYVHTPGDTQYDVRYKRRLLGIVVSRYLRHAEAYIKNVAKGHFPRK